ncbi:MAG: FKBP-type peptidyl-prolyl cis-trans isomerase [Bernardetiaceae bacterium]|nr:FKBP-type peptidyl-prolyl cis-trans isomerase [Bernardetiaceae bacterium]
MKYCEICVWLLVALVLFSCEEDSKKKNTNRNLPKISRDTVETKTGLRYIHHLSYKGPKPNIKDYLMLNHLLIAGNDTIINSYDGIDNEPTAQQLLYPPYPGAVEAGLALMSEGDSMTVFVNRDKLLDAYEDLPAVIERLTATQDKYVRYVLKLHKIVPPNLYDSYMSNRNQFLLSKHKSEDPAVIEAYLKRKGIKAQKHEMGFYYEIIEEGEGNIAKDGDSIRFHHETAWFTARQKEPKVFDKSKGNIGSNAPIGYILGTRNLIPGWELALRSIMKQNTKAVIYIPGYLGFGRISPNAKPPVNKLPHYAMLRSRIEMDTIIPKEVLTKK